ncbi:hypothetical protein LBMAG53_33330 [Planctomycetota bacterium]|nr:hypothetical protein LBMAG53_33330 [Planctomycetota bacterium]
MALSPATPLVAPDPDLAGWSFALTWGGTTRCDPRWDQGWHPQSDIKIYRIRSGTCRYDAGSGWRDLAAGPLHLIPSGRHRLSCPKVMLVDWVHVRIDHPGLRRLAGTDITTWTRPDGALWMTRCLAAVTGADPAARLGIIALLIDGLARRIDTHQRHSVASDPRLAVAADHLNRYWAEPTAVATASGLSGLHPAHFRRQFKRAFGASPQGYVMHRRMEEARRVLADPSVTVAAAALAAGYADPLAFSKAFRRWHGRGPREWRRQPVAP